MKEERSSLSVTSLFFGPKMGPWAGKELENNTGGGGGGVRHIRRRGICMREGKRKKEKMPKEDGNGPNPQAVYGANRQSSERGLNGKAYFFARAGRGTQREVDGNL